RGARNSPRERDFTLGRACGRLAWVKRASVRWVIDDADSAPNWNQTACTRGTSVVPSHRRLARGRLDRGEKSHMTRAVRRATAEGDALGTQAAAALASRPAQRRGPASRDAGECWSLRLTPDERRTLGEGLDSLTEREREVALAICDGGSNEAVAERLFIALPTLRTHLMRINQKLGTRSKGDVVRLMVGRLLDG